MAVSLGGCTGYQEYVRNGFKVGPNYCPPKAAVAQDWIDAADIRQADNPTTVEWWWMVFGDPKLNYLVDCAYRQNLTLREAGSRILQARSQLGIAVGSLFPQQQNASGDYRRNGSAVDPSSPMIGSRFSDHWDFGFSLGWELDFWGRYRRAIAAADDNLDAAVFDYDAALVTLLADVAENYVTVRTTQKRIELLRANVELQQKVLKFIGDRLSVRGGYKVTALDADQAMSNLRQTEAGIPQLEIAQRQAENRLCVLMGMPPSDLRKLLEDGPIPAAPPDLALGIPADLLRRRPDVRRAERLAAAQAEQIGIAESDLYPAFSINGTMGYSARHFPELFNSTAFNGSVGPSFQWNLLNYGRIVNNVRLQDEKFRELVFAYQNAVLKANEEVENGLVTFLRAQRRSRLLDESVDAAQKAVKIVVLQYEKGAVDFNRYANIEQSLVNQQDLAAQAKGQIAQGMIAVYRALGGGWEIENENWAPPVPLPPVQPPPAQTPPEDLPLPEPDAVP